METKTNTSDTLFNLPSGLRRIIFVVLFVFCLFPIASPPFALVLGLLLANLSGHPFLPLNHRATQILLQLSVVGLGFGMNAYTAVAAGASGFFFTVVSVISTLILGTILGKKMGIDRKIAHLIASGTAICGGSAIAAIAPVIKADAKQTSVALGAVFILNSVALFLFPLIGHWLDLSQKDFGLWCAIAIHDTSSVVGAANKYGPEALEIATTVKLARALWIIPLALFTSYYFKNSSGKIKIPYFIGFFILAILLNTYLPQIQSLASQLVGFAKTGLTLTLFLIGAGLHRTTIMAVGLKPFFQAVLLWLFISLGSLLVILSY